MEGIKRNLKICRKCDMFKVVSLLGEMYYCMLSGAIMEGYFEDGQHYVKLNSFSKTNWANQDIPDCCEFKAEYCVMEWSGDEKENDDGRRSEQ